MNFHETQIITELNRGLQWYLSLLFPNHLGQPRLRPQALRLQASSRLN